MGFTNVTPNYELPQFIDSDKPTWRGDINYAFNVVDTELHGKLSLSDLDDAIGDTQSDPNAVSTQRRGVLTPSTIDHDGLQAAFDAAKTFGLRVQAAGEYSTDQTLVIGADCDLQGLHIDYNGTSTAVSVRGPVDNVAISNHTFKMPSIRQTRKTVAGWSQVVGTIGVDLRNLARCVVDLPPSVSGFETGVRVIGANTLHAYNTYNVGHISSNKRNLVVTATGTGWVNENNFWGGGCSHDSSDAAGGTGAGMTGPAIGTRHVLLTSDSPTWAGPNNNRFYGMSLENVGTTEFAVDFDNAHINLFDGCRWETWLGGVAGKSPRVKYGATSRQNEIRGGYDAHRIKTTGGSAGNNITAAYGSRYHFLNQPAPSPGDVGGWIVDNVSGVTNPHMTVMPGGWETAEQSASAQWLWKWTGQMLEGKRAGDEFARVRLDGNASTLRLGPGTADPVNGLLGTASDLRSFTSIVPSTHATNDLGTAANRWRKIYASDEVHVGNLILRDNSGSLQIWNGTAWKTVSVV